MITAPKVVHFSLANTDVDTTLEDVGGAVILAGECSDVVFTVSNLTAAIALSDFSLMIQTHESADFINYITGTTWETVAAPLTFKSANVNTLAGAATAHARVDVGPVYAIKFQAKAASGTGNSVTIIGQAA